MGQVRARSAQLAGDLLGWKNHGYPVQNFFIQWLLDFLNKSWQLLLLEENSTSMLDSMSSKQNLNNFILKGALPNVVVAHPICLTVVFSRHLKRWWCCSSKTSSLKFSSKGKPAALAAILASAAFFLDTNAAPEVAFAIWMRASRAFCN